MTKETNDQEILTRQQRWLELLVLPAMLLLSAFLVYHQVADTGFFTEKFGTMEMLGLYVPIVANLLPPIARALTGRRNPARPFEAATSLLLMAGSLWLVIVFPFDYSHLADILPAAIRPLLAWVTDGLGKALLIFQVIIGLPSASIALWKYSSIRSQKVEAGEQK